MGGYPCYACTVEKESLDWEDVCGPSSNPGPSRSMESKRMVLPTWLAYPGKQEAIMTKKLSFKTDFLALWAIFSNSMMYVYCMYHIYHNISYKEAKEMCQRFGGALHFNPDPASIYKDNDLFEAVKVFSYGNQPNDRWVGNYLKSIMAYVNNG